jgi:hypothetical protein
MEIPEMGLVEGLQRVWKIDFFPKAVQRRKHLG